MLLKRRQLDKPAAALNKFCSIRTLNGVYAEFGIDSSARVPSVISTLTGIPFAFTAR